jgi:hypothetical protein
VVLFISFLQRLGEVEGVPALPRIEIEVVVVGMVNHILYLDTEQLHDRHNFGCYSFYPETLHFLELILLTVYNERAVLQLHYYRVLDNVHKSDKHSLEMLRAAVHAQWIHFVCKNG